MISLCFSHVGIHHVEQLQDPSEVLRYLSGSPSVSVNVACMFNNNSGTLSIVNHYGCHFRICVARSGPEEHHQVCWRDSTTEV